MTEKDEEVTRLKSELADLQGQINTLKNSEAEQLKIRGE